MKFGTKTDIDAPQAFVFGHLADFPAWERAALRRGIELERIGPLPQTGPGAEWKATFTFRGRRRTIALRIEKLEPPQNLSFAGTGVAVDGWLLAELIPMGPRRTRLSLQLEVKPRSLAARLYLQTLRLGRKRLETRFNDRISQLGQEIGEKFRRDA